MEKFGDLLEKAFEPADDAVRPHLSGSGYYKLRRLVVLATATVALAPLLILTVLVLSQYESVFRREANEPIARLTTNIKRSLELFLAERRSALRFIIQDKTFDELCSHEELERIIENMNHSLAIGEMVDLGMIDGTGEQLCYTGPFQLEGRNYADQGWFHEVSRGGIYISDVFRGFRDLPHLAIACQNESPESGNYILRATIDAKMLSEQILNSGMTTHDDVFLVNRQGRLQTPSRRYGEVLSTIRILVPHYSPAVEVVEQVDENGEKILLGYAYIENSPYVLMYVRQQKNVMGRWFTVRNELLSFLAVCTILILAVILWGSNQFVRNMREAARHRAELFHQVEYTNKLASIGRLAAGVAHEINNPLAIINEKAGLMKDLLSFGDSPPPEEKQLAILDSVLQSVQRCRTVTHRLLGFARHMDVTNEIIDLYTLLIEVLGFLSKEAEYRDIKISFNVSDNLPTLESDRSQLQQVFLNILNNAFAAVDDGASIAISLGLAKNGGIVVTITDSGVGIPKANLQRIFEPFFSTKEIGGTGLGLSITYGIVKKLGGDISVWSEVGKGTSFTITLPLRREAKQT